MTDKKINPLDLNFDEIEDKFMNTSAKYLEGDKEFEDAAYAWALKSPEVYEAMRPKNMTDLVKLMTDSQVAVVANAVFQAAGAQVDTLRDDQFDDAKELILSLGVRLNQIRG